METAPIPIPDESVQTLISAVTASLPASEPDLMEATYRDLRAIAASILRGPDARHTLQPTALVHEAYLKISGKREEPWAGVSHFVAVAARAMRQIVIDRARARNALKRGGGRDGARRETLSGVLREDTEHADVLDIHEHLTRLATIDPRRARVVELRFFGGLSTTQIAAVLGVSERTAELDWRVARAWLRERLEGRQA
jgi:RNA polymerase sigma-70 factor (ECF subfamily)